MSIRTTLDFKTTVLLMACVDRCPNIATTEDREYASWVLGFGDYESFLDTYETIEDAILHRFIMFLLISQREQPQSLNKIFESLIFSDKELETKLRKLLDISDDDETLSVKELNSIWEL